MAVQGSEHTSRLVHTRCYSGDVPRLHPGIERDINICLAQQSIVDAVTGPAESTGFAVKMRKTDRWCGITRVHICVHKTALDTAF
jgi:hypothetical protein